MTFEGASGDRDVYAFSGETLCDRGADAAAGSGHESNATSDRRVRWSRRDRRVRGLHFERRGNASDLFGRSDFVRSAFVDRPQVIEPAAWGLEVHA